MTENYQDQMRGEFKALVEADTQTMVKAITSDPSMQATLYEKLLPLVRDSLLWKGATGVGRVRVLGSAGLGPKSTNHYGTPHARYAHIGLELWTRYDEEVMARPENIETNTRNVADLELYASIGALLIEDREAERHLLKQPAVT